MANRDELLNDPETAMRAVLDGRQSSIWTAMPGIVDSVDYTTMTLSVQPAIQGTVTDENGVEQAVDLPLLIHVPICYPGAGDFILTFPIEEGDEVLVVFASRCIDAWWQSGGVQRPMEARMHDLSDGFAIPGPRSQPNKVSSISSSGLQLRNKAGTTYLEIAGDGKLKLVAPDEVDVTAPLVKITGNLTVSGTIVATGNITGAVVTGSALATSGGGSATIGGGLAVTGNITAAQVTSGGIGLSTHKHTGVTTGVGTSGGPTP